MSSRLRTSMALNLPHDVRRRAFQLRYPRQFAELQRRRRGTSDNFADFSSFELSGALMIHVPKVAGRSIAEAIYGKQPAAHVTLETYRLVYPRKVFERLTSFAFVRNPWNRTRSAYDFLVQQRDNPDHSAFARHLMDFDDFDDFVDRGLHTSRVRRHQLFKTQLHFIARSGGREPAVDVLGRYEQLDADFADLMSRLGLEGRELPHRHRTNDGHTEPEWKPDTIEKIAQIYGADAEALGYQPPTSS